MKPKPKVGIYGISGCAGCLLTVLYEDCFKELMNSLDLKAFPLIKQDKYDGDFDYCFIEGTVCFDKDIKLIKELRKRSKYIVALGSCSCVGCIPSMRNFRNNEKTMKFVYPRYNHLNEEDPTPINKHIKVDYYIPQCPPNKDEILRFIESIAKGIQFKSYIDPVCVECRKKGNLCLLTKGEICLGPITTGGCDAICPSNNTECYGCRGPCEDANIPAFKDMLKQMGYTKKDMHDKMETFAGLQFQEKEGEKKSTWLEK